MTNDDLWRKINWLEDSEDGSRETNDSIRCLQKAIGIMQEELKKLNKKKKQETRKKNNKIRALWEVAHSGWDNLPDDLLSKSVSEIDAFRIERMRRIDQEIDENLKEIEDYNRRVLEGRDTEDDDF